MIPGRTLHRLALRLFGPSTIELVIAPAITDLQKEYAEAEGPYWRTRWILLRGYVAVLKVLALSAGERFTVSAGDRRALARAVALSAGVGVIAVAALMIPPLANMPIGVKFIHIVEVIPQALPLAIPVGLTFGIAVGLGGRSISRAARGMVLLIALLASLVSFGVLHYVMPAANQAYRQQVFRAMGGEGEPTKGDNEMTRSELQREIARVEAAGHSEKARQLAWKYHIRSGLAAATVILACVALFRARRTVAARVAISLGTCVVYIPLLNLGASLSAREVIPTFVGAWLPNLLFTFYFLLSTFTLTLSSNHRFDRQPS